MNKSFNYLKSAIPCSFLSMPFIVNGDMSLNTLQNILSSALPHAKIICTSVESNFASEMYLLQDKIEKLNFELQLSLKLLRINEAKYEDAINEMTSLRKKYDDCLLNLSEALWMRCAGCHQSTKDIPPMKECIESVTRIGPYSIGEQIGEGQFGFVFSCLKDGYESERATKIISKNRIQSFKRLSRLSTEISNLKHLKSPYVIELLDVIHTETKLYIITEKGGADLFEFFDLYPEGVPENWTKEIMCNISHAVYHCHLQGICHRDLKPENILMKFDPISGTVLELKLCDFGLSSKLDSKIVLTDFCGSPGFMAPEIVFGYDYNGEKADVWSVGCIMLELLIGQEAFIKYWLSVYEPDVIEDKNEFRFSMRRARDKLSTFLPKFAEMTNLLESIIDINPIQRLAMSEMIEHSWFHHCIPLMKEKTNRKNSTSSSNTSKKVRKQSSSILMSRKVFPMSPDLSSPALSQLVVAHMNKRSNSGYDVLSRVNSENSMFVDTKASGEFYIWNTDISMLVVDPSAETRGFYTKLLQGRCRHCVEAQNGTEALEAITQSMRIGGAGGGQTLSQKPNMEVLSVAGDQRQHQLQHGEPHSHFSSAKRHSTCSGSSPSFNAILIEFDLPDADGPSTVRAARSLGYTGVVIGVVNTRDRDAKECFLTARVDYVLERPVDVLKLNRILADRFD